MRRTLKREDDITTRFGRRVLHLRLARDMTQREMCDQFGIDRSWLSSLERGRKSISLPMLEVFAVGFDIELCELVKNL